MESAKLVMEELNGKLIPETNKYKYFLNNFRIFKLNWASYSAGKQAAMSTNQSNILFI